PADTRAWPNRKNSLMGITNLIGWLFGADAAAATDATKLDGTTEAALARSLSALSPDERGWITFAEARILFSTKSDQYAFGETDDDGRKAIESSPVRYQLYAGRGDGLFRTRSDRSECPLSAKSGHSALHSLMVLTTLDSDRALLLVEYLSCARTMSS